MIIVSCKNFFSGTQVSGKKGGILEKVRRVLLPESRKRPVQEIAQGEPPPPKAIPKDVLAPNAHPSPVESSDADE